MARSKDEPFSLYGLIAERALGIDTHTGFADDHPE